EVDAKGVAELDVTFAPTCVGALQAQLVLTTCDDCAATTVELRGNATGAKLAVSPDLLAFDVTPPHGARVKELTVENQGCTPITPMSANAGDQPFAAIATFPMELESLTPVVLNVSFTPAARASYSGELTVQAGDLSQKV